MSTIILLFVYCVLIAAASFFGGWIPNLIKLTHLRMQIMMSLVSGLMLGVAILHLLPHSYEMLGDIDLVAGAVLVGLLVMFFLMRMFHVHHHGSEEDSLHDHGEHEKCDGDHNGQHISWYGLFFGMAIHTVLDGFALASSVAIEADATDGFELIAFGTFLAVFLHKPLDALSITSVMQRSGLPLNKQVLANVCFSLACPLGALFFWLGAFNWFAETHTVIGLTLAFSAGAFLCIALADLLPEVHFHSHDRGKLSTALLVGVGIAFVIELFHSHDHESESKDDHQEVRAVIERSVTVAKTDLNAVAPRESH